MYHGSCLCGKIKFTISDAIENIVHCHCSLCRKAQGSAFATNANIKSEHFNFLEGEDNLTSYSPSSTQTKYFCKTCGSPMMSKNSTVPEYVRIRYGRPGRDRRATIPVEKFSGFLFASRIQSRQGRDGRELV